MVKAHDRHESGRVVTGWSGLTGNMKPLQNRRSGFSAESRTLQFAAQSSHRKRMKHHRNSGLFADSERYGTALNLLEKCGGLPTAATMKGSFSEVSIHAGATAIERFADRRGSET
jgi:hypothetical protein